MDGIGDPTERIVPLRTHDRRYGERHKTYGLDNMNEYPEAVKKSGRYPLFTAADIRRVQGAQHPYSSNHLRGDKPNEAGGVAYHLHNWFDDLKVLRNKYVTYAHGTLITEGKPLSLITEDLDIMVRCIRGIGNEGIESFQQYYEEGRKVKGPRPIFFLNATYLEERHKLVKVMVRRDEEKFGSKYDSKASAMKTIQRKKVKQKKRNNV